MIDHENNEYKTKQIGNLTWTIENFRATTSKDGKELNFAIEAKEVKQASSKEIPSICLDYWDYYYKNAKPRNRPENFKEGEYGYLYNGFIVQNAQELILPEGWRIPTIEDFKNLYESTGKTGYEAIAALRTGNPINIAFKDPLDANNLSGFSAIPRGYRGVDGKMLDKDKPYFWTNTEKKHLTDDKRLEYIVLPNINEGFQSTVPSLLGAYMNLRFVKD